MNRYIVEQSHLVFFMCCEVILLSRYLTLASAVRQLVESSFANTIFTRVASNGTCEKLVTSLTRNLVPRCRQINCERTRGTYCIQKDDQ